MSAHDTELRWDMADPDKAMIMTSHAGRKIAYRCWPRGDSDEHRAAFLDGLAKLADRLGLDVFGFWLLVGDDYDEMAPADMPCQLWLANNRLLLLMEGTYGEAVDAMHRRYDDEPVSS